MELRDHPSGGYRFLATGRSAPYSAGIVASPSYEIVHATLRHPLPIDAGFALIEQHLRSLGRSRTALCAVELRGAAPYTPAEWSSPDGFNERYRTTLRAWDLFVDGYPAVARTNVVPVVNPPAEQVLHAFSYTVPLAGAGAARETRTFVTSGAPEAAGMWESSATADERLLSSLDAIGAAIAALGGTWDQATSVDIYLREGISTSLAEAALQRIGAAARYGLHWHLTKTPLLGPYLECDARSVRHELLITP